MIIQDVKDISESFQAIAIGIGALISAATLSPALLKIINNNVRVNRFRKAYPAEDINNTFILVNNPHRGRGHVYLLDSRTMTSHHVENPETMRDLLFDWSFVRDIDTDDYDKYKNSSIIDTKSD